MISMTVFCFELGSLSSIPFYSRATRRIECQVLISMMLELKSRKGVTFMEIMDLDYKQLYYQSLEAKL